MEPQADEPSHVSSSSSTAASSTLVAADLDASAPSVADGVLPRPSPAAAAPSEDSSAGAATATASPQAAMPPPTPTPEPVRAMLPSSPGFVVPSYSVLPRPVGAAGSAGAPQTCPAQTFRLPTPMSASALQPPVPGQYAGNRPSFSYNVVSHANPSLPTGQQLQLNAPTAQGMHGSRFAPPASLQPPVPVQLGQPTNLPSSGDNVNTSSNFNPSSESDSSSKPVGMTTLPSGSSTVQTTGNLSRPPNPVILAANSGFQGTFRPVAPQALISDPTPSFVAQNNQQQFYPGPGYPHGPVTVPTQQPGLSSSPHLNGMPRIPGQLYMPGPPGSINPAAIAVPSSNLPSFQPAGVLGIELKDSASTSSVSYQSANASVTNSSYTGDSKAENSTAWTMHRTESGALYYYNSLTGESTYQRPASFIGEQFGKDMAQTVPVSWVKVVGTDWSVVTTNDGKKYYYDNKNKVSSWQLPPEVAELTKNMEPDLLKGGSTSLQDTGPVDNKLSPNIATGASASQSGVRDSVALRPTAATASSALDLIKKKLQDAGSPGASTLPALTSSPSDVNGSKAADAAPKGHQTSDSSEKLKDADGDRNQSDVSSDSDEDEGPSKEECVSQFKEMLKERGVAPFSKWEKELPKIIFDPRFKAISSHSARRAIFENFVRTRAEEERKEKRAAQKAAVDVFKQLLEEASVDINHKTDYREFERKWASDPRFEALDRKERENLLHEKVKAAEEKIQAMRSLAAANFKKMLQENTEITINSRWSKVKDGFRSDPRYKSVKHEDRELWFNEYLSELKSAKVEAERRAKDKVDEQDKLKERERELKKRKERDEQEMERVKMKIQKKEAVTAYQALLVEMIKDPKASWTLSRPKLEKDPQGRAANPNLSQSDAEKLFRDHLKDLYERCMRDFRTLLSEVITTEAAAAGVGGNAILTSWNEAKELLKSDPRYNRVSSKDRETLWRRHTDDLMRKQRKSEEKPNADAKKQRGAESSKM